MSEESLPLKGRTFLITRTDEGNKLERAKLENLGAKVIDLPVIEIQPPTNQNKIDEAFDQIDAFDWIVFTSSNGVKAFIERMTQRKNIGKEKIKARFACVGLQTAQSLEEHGFEPSLVPSEFLTSKLGLEMTAKFNMLGQKVLLARAEEANAEITNQLERAGAIVVDAPMYRTIAKKLANLDKKRILEIVTDITLTSPSTVRGLLLNISASEIKSKNIKVHCIGPVTANAALESGLDHVMTAKVHSLDGLIVSLCT
jgi:uroporphyrinogen III methyltransferase/synthase